MISLSIEKRGTVKPDALRSAGKIPAVLYGKKQESIPVAIKLVDFNKAFDQAGESTVITLQGDGMSHDALVHEVQYDAVRDIPIHVDFYVFEKGQKVKVHVPVEFEGVSGAVKDLGATLVKVLHEIEVEAEPSKLPKELVADISLLTAMDSQVLAKDIKLPAGVELAGDPEEVVAAVSEAMKEVETPIMDISQIEVEKKGKQEEEGAEGAAAAEEKPAKE